MRKISFLLLMFLCSASILFATEIKTASADDGNSPHQGILQEASTSLGAMMATANCESTVTVYLDENGDGLLTTEAVDDGTSVGDTMWLDRTEFTCADIASSPITVTLSVQDGGGTTTCTSQIEIVDNNTPTALCQDVIAQLDSAGNASIDSSMVDNGSSAVCSIISMTLSDTAFTCADAGVNTVTLTVTANNGASATCDATVTVEDNIAPVVYPITPIVVHLDMTGNASITTAMVDSVSTDNCGIDTKELSQTDFTCDDFGQQTVNYTVTDVNGNATVVPILVNVSDAIVPVAICQPAFNIYLDASGGVGVVASDLDNGSTDNCTPILTIEGGDPTYSCSDIDSTYTLTLNVADQAGNDSTCTVDVTILDTVSPNAQCVADLTVYLDTEGDANITVADINNGSSDNCSIQDTTIDISAFDCGDAGANTVTLTVTDSSGNTSTCTTTVNVADTISPTITCSNTTIYLDANGEASTSIPTIVADASDNCSSVILSADHGLIFDCSQTGANNVEVTAEDNSGNTATCTSVVTILDTISPTADCRDTTLYLDENGNAELTDASVLANGSTDNCGIASITPDGLYTYSCEDVGSFNSIDFTVTDSSGNSSTCISEITIEDTVPPVALCYDSITAILDHSNNPPAPFGPWFFNGGPNAEPAQGNQSNLTWRSFVYPQMIDSASYDNCQIDYIELDRYEFDCSDAQETQIVTLYVVDDNGNESTCETKVTVVDMVAPKAECVDTITVYLDAQGLVEIDSSMIDNNSTDNCDIASMELSKKGFCCDDISLPRDCPYCPYETVQTVTLSVMDYSRNHDECTTAVVVLDTITPTAMCQTSVTAYIDEAGQATVDTSMINDGSSDNCSIAMLSLDTTTFSCDEVGTPHIVTLTVEDPSGNSATCQTMVAIMDTTPPTAMCKDVTIEVDADGNASIDSSMVDNGSYDNCGVASLMLDNMTFTCDSAGDNTVTLTVTDVNGLTSTCTSTVTVEDNILPTAVCKDITLYLDADGNAAIDSSMLDDGSTDNCGINSMAVSHPMLTGANLGNNTVSLMVYDAGGNMDRCNSTVTIVDTLGPNAKCNFINICLDRTGNYTLTNEDIFMLTHRTTDNVTPYENMRVNVSPMSFGCDNLDFSTYPVDSLVYLTINIEDLQGNESTCGIYVHVSDTFPLVTSPNPASDIEVSLGAGVCETTIDNYPSFSFSRECVELEQISGLGANGVFPIGVTTETWQYTYAKSHVGMISFDVIVKKPESMPTLAAIADVTTDEDVAATVSLSGISGGDACAPLDIVITATSSNDNLIEALNVSYTPGESTGSLEIVPVPGKYGTAMVTVKATDVNGAVASQMFKVTVNAVNDAPVVVKPIDDIAMIAKETRSVEVSKVLGELFDDVDDTELTHTIKLTYTQILPDWVRISETETAYTMEFMPMQKDTGCYNFVVKATDAAGASVSDVFEVCVDKSLVGISDLSKGLFEVKLYPNPTKGAVNLETEFSANKEVEVSVVNIAGSEVFRKTYKTGNTPIRFDLSNQVSGMYMVVVDVDGKKVIKKLLLDK